VECSRPGDRLRRGLRCGWRSRPGRPESALFADEDDELLLSSSSLLLSAVFRVPPRRIATFCGTAVRARRGDRRKVPLCGCSFMFPLSMCKTRVSSRRSSPSYRECEYERNLEGAEGSGSTHIVKYRMTTASTTRRICLIGGNTLIYEFRIVNASAASSSPIDIHRRLEEMVHTWRTAARWILVVGHDGEMSLTAHVVVQRKNSTARLDNNFLGFQRQLRTLLANNCVPRRRIWTAVKGSLARVYADVRFAVEPLI